MNSNYFWSVEVCHWHCPESLMGKGRYLNINNINKQSLCHPDSGLLCKWYKLGIGDWTVDMFKWKIFPKLSLWEKKTSKPTKKKCNSPHPSGASTKPTGWNETFIPCQSISQQISNGLWVCITGPANTVQPARPIQFILLRMPASWVPQPPLAYMSLPAINHYLHTSSIGSMLFVPGL